MSGSPWEWRRDDSGFSQKTAEQARTQECREHPDQDRVREQAQRDDQCRTICESMAEVEEQKGQRPGEGAQDRDSQKDALLARMKRSSRQGHRESRARARQPPGVAIERRQAMAGHVEIVRCARQWRASNFTRNAKALASCRAPPTRWRRPFGWTPAELDLSQRSSNGAKTSATQSTNSRVLALRCRLLG